MTLVGLKSYFELNATSPLFSHDFLILCLYAQQGHQMLGLA